MLIGIWAYLDDYAAIHTMQDKNLESIKFVSSNLQNKMTSVKINKSFAAHFSEFLR